MADFDPPSFSLGFDFDQTEETKPPNHVEDTDEDFETLTVLDSDSQGQDSVPKLKRLRRGSLVQERVPLDSVERKGGLDCSVVVDDDDIDEFSSQEDEHLSTPHPSVLNSSKFPLNAHGILTKQLGKRKQNVLNDPESVITSCNKPPFPNSTSSPLRRFQLLDSDSDFDDPFISENATNKTFNVSGEPRKLNESVRLTTRKDLWEDFPLDKSFNIPTPALDSFCDEYFSSMKDKSKDRSNARENNNQSVRVTSSVVDLGDPRPPAHQYFFHIDQRVQDLVRTRLPNFYPLNAANQDSKQPSTSNIDYMGQFCRSETSKQAARTNKAETSSRKHSKKSKAEETSQGFVNPKRGARKETPKDAGKRRVQADGQAAGIGTATGTGVGAGHWFTNQEGKRVYVSKNGQELTGRAAYMLYKKETGGGFKNKKAKRSSTKKK